MKAPKPKEFLNILCKSGLQPAICVDVHDEGEHEEEWQGRVKMKPKVSIHFLLADVIPATWTHPQTNETVDVQEARPELVGRPFGVNRWFTFTMDDRGALRQFLTAWRGRDMTDQQAWDFDLETLIGVPAYLNIIHKQTQDGTKWYNRIHSALPLPQDIQAPEIPQDYKRRKDRDNDGAAYEGNGQNTRPPKEIQAKDEYGIGPDVTGDPIPESVVDGSDYDDSDMPF